MNVSDENFRMTQKQSILSDLTGLRIDGRKPNELRRLNCQISVADDCDGSAYLEQGLTKVLAVVHGPHEVYQIINCSHQFKKFYNDFDKFGLILCHF